MNDMYPKFLFADLDDTLFQSLEKCRTSDGLEPAAFLKDGLPISYTTALQRAFFAFAKDGMTVIPSTARNRDAFSRVSLPFDSYAVLNYGGMVLSPGGDVDTAWRDQMHDAMHAALPGLQELSKLLDDYAVSTGFGGRTRLIEDSGTPFYLVLKDPQKRSDVLAPFEREVAQAWLADGDKPYYLHRNGNNFAVLPSALNKAHAVRYVQAQLRREHGAIMTFGMGDSRADAAFMSACDYAIVPSHTQLAGLTLEAL
jgi:hydroxymethylpyrimidine pyrophosphatase-like HAD family hydrolase